MKIFKSLDEINVRGAVVAIGNYDGVHKGHQALLAQGKEIARAAKKPLAVLTFEPHPRQLFQPDDHPGRLTPASVKAWRLQEEGVEILYSLPFNWDFASQSADIFIEKILKEALGTSHIIVGHDFRFGQMRKGTPEDIKAAGIPVTVIDEIKDESNAAYSSSRARQLLQQGDINAANEILGWAWEMRGIVIKGDSRGHEIGYPTANTALGETVHPAYGVYAARVNILGEDKWYDAAINIGIRPMFEIPEAQVESYIFAFDREIYGQILRVQPVQHLRSEAKFNSLDELRKQIAEDCKQVTMILKD